MGEKNNAEFAVHKLNEEGIKKAACSDIWNSCMASATRIRKGESESPISEIMQQGDRMRYEEAILKAIEEVSKKSDAANLVCLEIMVLAGQYTTDTAKCEKCGGRG